MKYIYGPLRSRRLGMSLGVDLTVPKTCNFDCVYCQLGSGALKIDLRGEYVPIKDILEELASWLGQNPEQAGKIDYVTLSGSGEPTLNLHIGRLIDGIKKLSLAKVAVLTNASLLSDDSVRQQLIKADLVVPSLDAVTQDIFVKINRPMPGINVEEIINGLIEFRRQFAGKIWLEVMLVGGINDGMEHINKLKDAVERIRPDKIQLNSPARTTAVLGLSSVDKKKLERIKEILGERCEIV